jgi:hypothetical protein
MAFLVGFLRSLEFRRIFLGHDSSTALDDSDRYLRRSSVAHVRQPLVAAGDDVLGQARLLGQQLVDALFDRADRDELVHLHDLLLPMRWARSVACASTAGFHQRSKWKT